MLRLARSSPLAERGPAGPRSFETAEVRIEELDLGMAMLRCHRSQTEAAGDLFARACGWALPTAVNDVVVHLATRALALEPGAWMLTGDRDAIAMTLTQTSGHFADQMPVRLVVLDMTDGRCMLKLSGTGARTLIETGCPIDLHSRVFQPGRCASSLYNETPIVIDQLSDEPAYAAIVDRAAAHCLWDQLSDAAHWLA